MTRTFPLRVRDALDDAPLGAALGRMSGLLQGRRAQAFASLPDADAIRDQRAQPLAHPRALGPARTVRAAPHRQWRHVHWAETAATAVASSIEIARQHGVRLAVKSKSMVTEETT